MAVDGRSTPRQRYRDQVRAEIKHEAVEQIRAGGIPALSLNAVAKRLGLTGPALYKYFRSRDDLLTELIGDAYDEAAAVIRRTGERVADAPARERLRALGAAYRQWALEAPHLYLLLAGTPSPSYQAPAEMVERARAVLGPFLPVLAQGRLRPGVEELRAQLRRWLDETPAVVEWVTSHTSAGDPATALAGTIIAWTRLHGVVSLEVQGQFAGMGHQAATLVEVEMDSLADVMGLPAPTGNADC